VFQNITINENSILNLAGTTLLGGEKRTIATINSNSMIQNCNFSNLKEENGIKYSHSKGMISDSSFNGIEDRGIFSEEESNVIVERCNLGDGKREGVSIIF
jgi:hypothetical protein